MTPVVWMAGAGLLLWLVLRGMFGAAVDPEARYALLAPLVATSMTWVVTARTYRRNPQGLTAVMVVGMLIKAIFFAVYVAAMLRGLDMRPRPFVLSFTVFFIVLYGLEALFLKRLFADGMKR